MQLNKNDYYNFLAIRNNLLNPLKKFMSLEEILSVAKNFNYNDNFFTIPFFLTADDDDIKQIKNNKLTVYFKRQKIYDLPIISISNFKKKNLSDLLFGKYSSHPYMNTINLSKNYVIETGNFAKSKNQNIKQNNLTGFATRNIPHKGHEKIILNITKKNKVMVIINSEITINKKTNVNKTISSYKKFINKNKLKSKIILKKINIPSTMLGYRQAYTHALIGKNLGCNNFIIGRDHSGYKKFYKEFESFNFCKKHEKKLGIKILSSGSPVYCKSCKRVVFRNECSCKVIKIDISASLIRNLKNKNLRKSITNF